MLGQFNQKVDKLLNTQTPMGAPAGNVAIPQLNILFCSENGRELFEAGIILCSSLNSGAEI